MLGACAPRERIVYQPVYPDRVPRPSAPVLEPLDRTKHICSPENLETMLRNTLELRLAVKLRDDALDAYEAQTGARH